MTPQRIQLSRKKGWRMPENTVKAFNDPYQSKEYQIFVESMVKHCRCKPPFDCPCAGVLAGGLCDELGLDDHMRAEDGYDYRYDPEDEG